MDKKRFVPAMVLTLFGLALLFIGFQQSVDAQGENLLVNPGFEGKYSAYAPETPQESADCPVGICNTAQVPAGWKPWWIKERPTDVNPEYKPATLDVAGNRVRSGSQASQYFSFWTTHKAGLRQTVTVPANAVLEFSVWGHTWMSEADSPLVSDRSGTPNMRIGIDPTGGTNPYSPEIVWSGYQQAYDVYQRFAVQGQARGDRVTVFTFAAPSVNPNSPEYGFKHTDMYWDDAALVVIGQASSAPPPADSAPPAEPAATPVPAVAAVPFVPGPTATPDADGIIYSEALPGDSLWAIAARAGIDLERILEYNNLSREDFINPGDLLIIGYGDPEAAEAEVAEPEIAEADSAITGEDEPVAGGGAPADGDGSEAASELAPDPQSMAISQVEQEIDGGVTVCLSAFDDANGNASHDADEGLRPSVAFTISDGQKVVTNYITDGESEPFCVRGLVAGTYRISRSKGPDEVLTTAGDHSVTLTENSSISLEFGSTFDDGPAAKAVSDDALANEMAADPGQDAGNLLVIAVVIALILMVAVLIIILTARRAAT